MVNNETYNHFIDILIKIALNLNIYILINYEILFE